MSPQEQELEDGGGMIAAITFFPILAFFIGTLLVAIFEITLTGLEASKVPDSASALALFGFAAVLAVFFGAQWLLASWFSCRIRRSEKNSLRLRKWAAAFVESAPLWIPLWLVATSLFEGAKARVYALDGIGPIMVFLFLLFAWGIAKNQWSQLRERSVSIATLALLLAASVFHIADRSYYLGIYPTLHQGLSFFAIVFASIAIDSVRKAVWRRGHRILVGTIVVACFIGIGSYHLKSFFDGPTSARAYLFQELTTTKSLIHRVPYARDDTNVVEPLALSPRFQRWNRQREAARKRISELRGSKPLNLLVVSIDAVRRDHTSLHGYVRKTTPFLEELAAKAMVFEDARSPSTASFFSLTSTLSGAFPSSISLMNGQDPDFLGRAMKEAGYQTLGIYTEAVFGARPPNWPMPDMRLGQERHVATTDDSDVLVPQVLAAMSQMKSQFFLLTHLMDPHFPYQQRPGFRFGETDMDAYDSEIAFTDLQLRQLFEGMKERGFLENTIVVIAADHGESFGEHGLYLHCGDPFEEQCRIPFLVYLPFITEGKRIPGTVSLTSLAPTLVDILGTRNLANCEAPSLVPLILETSESKDYYTVVERPVIQERKKYPAVSALVKGKYKLRVQHDAGLKQLFDINSDPLETRDLSEVNIEAFQSMVALYHEWRSDCIFPKSESNAINQEFAMLRNEILLGRDDRIAEVLEMLGSPRQELARSAAYLLFDLEMTGSLPHTQGLCSVHEDFKDSVVDAFQDLLAANFERRPFRAASSLLSHPDTEVRKRAALTLWYLAKLPFARTVARERLEVETSQEVRVELHGVLAKAGDEIEISKLMAMAVELGGPVASRLILGVMHQDSQELSDFIEQALLEDESLLSHTIILGLGFVDTEFRREVIERVLRLDKAALLVTAVKALRVFSASDWHEDLLCQVVRHERALGLRIDAANQLRAYPSKKASDALLDALAIFPDSAFTIGYLILAKTRSQVLEAWDAQEASFYGALTVDRPIPIRLPENTSADDHPRRLYLTMVGDSQPDEGETIEVSDADGVLLLKEKCVETVEFFHLDLDASSRPFRFPLTIKKRSVNHPGGHLTGNIFVTIISLRTPMSLWPSDAKSMSKVGVLHRFTSGWTTSFVDSNSCFLPAQGGGIRLRGAGEQRDEVTFSITTPNAACGLEIRLQGEVIGKFQLNGGNEKRDIRITEIGSLYRPNENNLFSFRVLDPNVSSAAPRRLEERMALHAVVLK
jgi:arylsulfatase A-like enzyme